MFFSSQLQPPEKFNFNRPTEWRSWMRRFERYCSASKLVEEGKFLVRDKTDDILNSFSLTEEQTLKYETVKGKFNIAIRGKALFMREQCLAA